MNKKLYKSNTDKKLCGVCGGLAAYLNMDSTIIRILFVVACAFAGLPLWLYLVAALVMPEPPVDDYQNNGYNQQNNYNQNDYNQNNQGHPYN